MVNAYQIAIAAHQICLEKLIPNGISKPHNYPAHLETAGWYADAINNSQIEGISPGAIVRAILEVTGWDTISPWPGHPSPEDVIKVLKAHLKERDFK